MRAATAKVKVPRAGWRLFKSFQGLTGDAAVARRPSPVTQMGQRFAMNLLQPMGFPKNYFHSEGDFMAGAHAALQHFAASTVAAAQGVEEARSHFSGVLDPGLSDVYSNGYEALESEGIEVSWALEEVNELTLGGLQLLCGWRRSRVPGGGESKEEGLTRHSYFGGSVVLLHSTEAAESGAWPAAESAHRLIVSRGATLYVEALVTAKQTVVLRERSGGEVLAADYSEAATHCLRLEAELVEPELRFDDEQGWIVCDLNDTLGVGGGEGGKTE